MDKYKFKLYITGQSAKSKRAVKNLQQLCEKYLPDRYELLVIDVLEQPELAEEEKVLATPTLIKELPPPVRWLVGDMSHTEKIILGLELYRED